MGIKNVGKGVRMTVEAEIWGGGVTESTEEPWLKLRIRYGKCQCLLLA